MRRSRSWIGAGLAAAALAGLAALLLRSGEEPPEIVSAPVARGPLVASVAATGTVNPVTSVLVGTYVSGPILEIDVDFNSPVRRGQRIAKIDPRSFVGKVESAGAELADARAQVRKAAADLRLQRARLARQEQLARSRVLSVDELDLARSNADQAAAQLALAEAGVDRAQAALKDAEVNLGYTDIVSPVDGIVVSRNVDVGQTVAASFQTPTLFVIAESLERMQVNAFVGEADIGRVQEGQPATFTVDAHPGRPFPAVVGQVRNSPTTLQNVVTYDVVLAVDNAARLLKPGMTANVRIETARVADALLVPTSALRFRPPDEPAVPAAPPPAGTPAGTAAGGAPGATVWRIADAGLEAVPVTPGLADDTTSAVESAVLREGDRVAVRVRTGAGRGGGPGTSLPGLGGGRHPR